MSQAAVSVDSRRGRKVRTPHGSRLRCFPILYRGAMEAGRPDGKCHRKYTATRTSRGKGEKVGQEPTVPDGDIGVHGKPPAEQDQIWEECSFAARRPVSFDSRVGRLDKWLPLPLNAEKTEFGLSAHSKNYLIVSPGSFRGRNAL